MTSPSDLKDAQSTPQEIWHTQTEKELFAKLQTSSKGLSKQETVSRKTKYGANRLPQSKPPSWWEIGIRQFQSPFVYILAVAAIVSLAIGELIDAGFIFGVLCLNALIGGFQEFRAEQNAKALQKLLQIRATVEREGKVTEIDAEEVVPGDIIWLESGNRVPADLRLILGQGLEIDESLLTGESLAVGKDAKWCGESSTPVADRLNMAYAGSIIVRGRGRGVVIGTGMDTEIGHLAKVMMDTGPGKPPLLIRMERFSQTLAWIVMTVISLVGILGVLFRGYDVLDMFMFGVALAVAVIPEGLPVALTIALAIGTSRMAERGVIVRRLAAVEGLGSCTMIASDKTGTLTCNELTVKEVRIVNGATFEITGQGFAPIGEALIEGRKVSSFAEWTGLESLVKSAVLCNEGDLQKENEAWIQRGDPTDIALLSLGIKLGAERKALLETYPQINQIPFEPEIQFSASYHELPTGEIGVYIKGSPERVLAMCKGRKNEEFSQRVMQTADEMAAEGYRVLAFAQGIVSKPTGDGNMMTELTDLEFLGFTGMVDPLREGVLEAIHSCQNAGIEVAIITGDHPLTALTIARSLGLNLNEGHVVTGAELKDKSPGEIQKIAKTARVFARVAPHQKLDLVNAMQANDYFVAVTGDGVNDAPALKRADVGIAMGRKGSEAAKEAAAIVLSDDNFASIAAAVREGRTVYDNLKKVIGWTLPTNAGESLVIVGAVFSGMTLPLTALQILWINLVTDTALGMALAFEPTEENTMKRPPRPRTEALLSGGLVWQIVFVSVLFAAGILGIFLYGESRGHSLDLCRTMVVNALVVMEIAYLFFFRNLYGTSLTWKAVMGTPPVWIAVILVTAGQFLLTYAPFMQSIFGTESVPLQDGAVIICTGAVLLFIMEFEKQIRLRIFNRVKRKRNR